MDDEFNLWGENDPSIKRLGSEFRLTEVRFSVNWYTGLTFKKNVKDEDDYVSNIESISSHDAPERLESRTFSHTHAVGGSGESLDTGCLEVSGDPLVAKKRSEVKEICFERPEELNVTDNCDTVNYDSKWITCLVENSKKYRYCNQKEQESTWEPPIFKEKFSSLLQLAGPEPDFTADSVHRSEKRRLSVGNIDLNEDVLCKDYFSSISKYWGQRFLLFSKFDEGIKMDEEGWFSATPECIAEHHAYRCGGGVIVDCFTGVGGNAIRFASKTTHVIAIDIDPNKIECAQHNASVYGVKDRIEFIKGDSFFLAPKLKADTIFLSPPWGGPAYNETKIFDINTMLKPHSGKHLFNVAKEIAPRVVMFLPKNSDIGQLADLALSARPPWNLEVEKNVVNDKLKAITAYFTKPLG